MTGMLKPIRCAGLAGLLGAGLLSATPIVRAEAMDAVDSRSVHTIADVEAEALEHAHGPRHGGYFGDADDLYHYEVLLEPPAQLILYVNDELNQPLDVRPLEGRWTLRPDGPSPVTGQFTPAGDGAYFLTELPLESQERPVHVKVEVLKDRQWAEMEFYLP